MKLILQDADGRIERGEDKERRMKDVDPSKAGRVFFVGENGSWACVSGEWYKDGKPVAEADVPDEFVLDDGRKVKTKKGAKGNWRLM